MANEPDKLCLGQELCDAQLRDSPEAFARLKALGVVGTDHIDSQWRTFECPACPFKMRLYEHGHGWWQNADACSLALAAVKLLISDMQA